MLLMFLEKTSFSYQVTKTANKFSFLNNQKQKYDLIDFNKSVKLDLEMGTVYDIDCRLGDYTNKEGVKEPRILEILACTIAKGYDLSLFIKKSRFDLALLHNYVMKIIESINDPFIRAISERLAAHADYVVAPAAKRVHNAWYGGLIEHSYALTMLCLHTVAHYKTYFPNISQDKVVFGCLFHDWGKVLEYNLKSQAYPTTREGELNPHVTRTANEVYLISESLKNMPYYNTSTRDELIHIILAHHGQLEWGSPVVPKTIEAVIVHHLDNLDSKMMHAHSLMDGCLKEFTEPSIDKTKYLRQEL